MKESQFSELEIQLSYGGRGVNFLVIEGSGETGLVDEGEIKKGHPW